MKQEVKTQISEILGLKVKVNTLEANFHQERKEALKVKTDLEKLSALFGSFRQE